MAKDTADTAQAPVKRRISPKIREAMRIRVREGIPWDDAARRAGVSPSGLYKARTKPHVKQELLNIEAQYIQEVEALKAPFKALAYEHARKLMKTAKSESVQARMVEFLAGEGKGGGVNVAVNVQQNNGGGYEYAPPGAQIVDITPSPDSPSSDKDDETPTK